MSSDAEQMIRSALRVVEQHQTGRCERCTDTGCPELERAMGLVGTPGEW